MTEFVFGVPEAVMTALPVLIIVGIIGPKWLREQRAKAASDQPSKDTQGTAD